MPSFDIVSETDAQEIKNAVDQTNREIQNRFDFKDSNARAELTKDQIQLIAPTDFQLKQVYDILCNKLSKRNVDMRCIKEKSLTTHLHEAKQIFEVKNGIEQEIAKKIIKWIKDGNWKVQASIQGDQVRVTGKKRDDLQEVIGGLRGATFELPLQFVNFRE